MKDLVREWLATAEPPENAVPGVEFRYDELGRKIGGGATTGRVTGAHPTVDYGVGVSPEARVWSALRTQLDSIDHCTLEEYVVARLQGQSIAHCRGRYGAVRDLGGVLLAEARREVEGAGFGVTLAPGRPAPTPEANGTVERQDPRPTQHLKRGQVVTLVVHAPHVPAGILAPDLVNLTRSEAKQLLESRGLVAALRAGSPARTPEQSDTIEAQKPAAGTPLERGSDVVIWVRSPFVAARTVPNVLGLAIREARAALGSAGIAEASTILASGGPAPTPALSGTVAAQDPAPGSTIAPGTRVTLKIHSAFVALRTVPSVVGLAGEAARQQLTAVGLEVQTVAGSPARSPEAAGTVAEQSPAAGSSVSAGTVVRLSIYAPYLVVPPTPEPVAPPQDRQTGWPQLECPATMPLGAAIGGLPAGTQIPLDPSSSGDIKSPGRPYELFVCSYRWSNLFNAPLLHATWVHRDATRAFGPDYCQDDSTNILGSRYLRSRTSMVQVQVFNRGLDWDQALRVGRGFLSQLEPYAKPCRGAVVPPVPPSPPPPTPPAPPSAAGVSGTGGRGRSTIFIIRRHTAASAGSCAATEPDNCGSTSAITFDRSVRSSSEPKTLTRIAGGELKSSPRRTRTKGISANAEPIALRRRKDDAMLDTIRSLLLTAVIALGCFAGAALTEASMLDDRIEGKVIAVDGRTVTVQIPEGPAPAVGDRLSVMKVLGEGSFAYALGNWRITAVRGLTLTAVFVEGSTEMPQSACWPLSRCRKTAALRAAGLRQAVTDPASKGR